jgi:hypothetical protein
MRLMSLVWWIGVVAIGWTLVAIGIGASGSRLPGRESLAPPVPVPTSMEAMPTTWPKAAVAAGYDLIDRTDGRRTPIRLRAGECWSNVSVSPWRGPRGELEAVGRWFNRDRDDFTGWAIFRVSDGTVVGRIATEILPTGRPCWVPGQPRIIVFAASDGQLHRCRLPVGDLEPVVARSAVYASGRGDPSDPVAWEVAPPGLGQPMLTDPVWPTDPRLRRLVFVSMSTLERRDGGPRYGPNQLWWLEMSDDAAKIVAAGRLIDSDGEEAGPDRFDRRFPDVAIGPDGRGRLVFLEAPARENTWRLRSVPLEFDQKTGRPRVVAGRAARGADAGEILLPAPLLLSADGATVYGLSPSGRPGAWPAVPRANRTEPGSPPEGRTTRIASRTVE